METSQMLLPLLAALVLGQSSEYPKVIRKNGQVCVQNLSPTGTVDESCRPEASGDYKAPLPSGGTPSSDRPYSLKAKLLPRELPTPTPAAMHWAEVKRNWALAFKFSVVTTLGVTLVSLLQAAIVSSVPHASDPYLVTMGVSAGVCGLSTLAAVFLDASAYEELYPAEEH
jgi:hypothetical protein